MKQPRAFLWCSLLILGSLTAGWCGAVPSASGAVAPFGLKVEYASEPLGIDNPAPRFSWILRTTEPGARSVAQSAYHIIVAGSMAGLESGSGILWDSGKVNSDETLHHAYAGAPLRSNADYWWKVQVWDQTGRPSGWSQPKRFGTAWLKSEEWKAKWIEAPGDVITDHNGYRSLLEKNSDTQKTITIDLLQIEPIDQIKLFPTQPVDVTPEIPGYLFPLRFRVDVSISPSFEKFNTVVDQTEKDYANPGAAPASFSFAATPGRYVRLVVTKLGGDGQGNFGLALAEMEVFKKLDRPPFAALPLHRAGAKLTATDSTEEGAWSLDNLNDGITTAQKGHAGKPSPASMFRKQFRVDSPILRARAYVSALGLYELRINGKKVGDGLLAPEWTDYNRHVQYQTFDISTILVPGENVIGALVADGWYAGRTSFIPGRRYWGDRPRFLAQVEIELKDGTRRTIVTDDLWKASTGGPIRSAEIFDGEVYDARRENAWDTAAFDVASWNYAKVFTGVVGKLVSQFDEPIQVIRELRPIAITEPAPGVYVFDMGQNMVGWVKLRAHGAAGTVVSLRHAEMLRPDGNIYTDNLRQNLQGARQTDIYTLKGAGADEVFEPHFTYHGFRYVEVSGLPYKPDLNAVIGEVFHSATPTAGTFESSSEYVNKLLENIRWTQISNMVGIPTDCPQRAERAGWLADAQVFTQTAIYNMNMARFYTRWLQDIRDSQGTDGSLPAFAPSPFGPATPSSSVAGWSDAAVIIPWMLYQNYGDKRVLEQSFDSAVRYVESIRKLNPDMIWRNGRGIAFGDWVNGDVVDIPDWPKSGASTPMDIFATAYFAYDADTLSKIAAALGREDEAREYSELSAQIRTAFRKNFVKPDGRIAAKGEADPNLATGAGTPVEGDNQATYAMALHFGLVPQELSATALDRLVEDIKGKYNSHLSTGIHSTRFAMLELADRGRTDVAYGLLTDRRVPSWGYMIDHGATTVWERWDGWIDGRGFQAPFMNSFNHYALGSVGEFIYKNIGGINLDPAKPAYKNTIIRPRPGAGVSSAKTTYESVRGPIISDWELDSESFKLKLSIPAGTSATVYVPATNESDVTESSKRAKEAQGVTLIGSENGTVVFHVGSGEYEFVSAVKH